MYKVLRLAELTAKRHGKYTLTDDYLFLALIRPSRTISESTKSSLLVRNVPELKYNELLNTLAPKRRKGPPPDPTRALRPSAEVSDILEGAAELANTHGLKTMDTNHLLEALLVCNLRSRSIGSLELPMTRGNLKKLCSHKVP